MGHGEKLGFSVCLHVSEEARDIGLEPRGVRVTGSCEPPSEGAGSEIWVFYKSSTHVLYG